MITGEELLIKEFALSEEEAEKVNIIVISIHIP